jgi:hypothetical protein
MSLEKNSINREKYGKPVTSLKTTVDNDDFSDKKPKPIMLFVMQFGSCKNLSISIRANFILIHLNHKI